MFGTIGRQDPPSMMHPQFYFGFLGVTATARWALFVAQGREGIDSGGATPTTVKGRPERMMVLPAMAGSAPKRLCQSR
jgi:hypothetical protein